MAHRACEIVGVRRDTLTNVTHLVCRHDDGSHYAVPVSAALAEGQAQTRWFFVTQGGEALLVSIQKNGERVLVESPVLGPIQLPDA